MAWREARRRGVVIEVGVVETARSREGRRKKQH